MLNDLPDPTGPTPETPGRAPETKPEMPPKPARPEKAKLGFWRRAWRWTLGLLIMFAMGALFITLVFYAPLRDRMQTQLGQRDGELRSANQKVSDLQSSLNNLSGLDTNNKDLQTQLSQSNLHVAILSARNDILAAQLAMAKNDPAKAKVALTNTPKTLDTLSSLLPADQRKTVGDLQTRLTQAIGELDNQAYAAGSDLDVLANSLLEMENALIARP